MACYHFTIKPDKKPDGTQISAANHIEYISRTGKYQDIDLNKELQQQKFSGNRLYSATANSKSIKKTPLYKSVFGSISEDKKGLDISDNASKETLQIALTLATKKYGTTLSVDGSTEYKAKVVLAALDLDLAINFKDNEMQNNLEKFKEKITNERNDNGRNDECDGRDNQLLESDFDFTGGIPESPPPPQELRDRVYEMSCRPLADNESKDTTMFLSNPVHDNLGFRKQRSASDNILRRRASETQKIKVNKIATEILAMDTKKVSGAEHTDYINRAGKFAIKGGCIYTAHHLPTWADDSPKKFFQAAEAYEGVGYSRYKEIEFALPNELSFEQQKELIDTFLDHHLKDFYYTYAVHDKIGVMSNGEHNTHVHITFSERKIDDREKEKERSSREFFARPSFSKKFNRETGGCRKDPKWNSKNRALYLCEMRKDFATIQNTLLEKYEHETRVDHRSLKAQHEDALNRGDLKMAELLNRLPEEHIGPTAALDPNNEKVISLQRYRQLKYEKMQLLYATDIIDVSMKKENALQAAIKNESLFKKLSDESTMDLINQSETLLALRASVVNALNENKTLKDIVIYDSKAAMKKIYKQHLSKDEASVYEKLTALTKQFTDMKNLIQSLNKPADYNKEALLAYQAIQAEALQRESEYAEHIRELKPALKEIKDRLSSPCVKAKIQEAYIQSRDTSMINPLYVSNDKLKKLLEQFQSEIVIIQTKQKTEAIKDDLAISAEDVYKELKKSQQDLKNVYDQYESSIQKIRKQIISIPRAEEIAKNIFVKGAFKKLRTDLRELDKDIKKFDVAKTEFKIEHAAFVKIKKPSWYQDKSEYLKKEKNIQIMNEQIVKRESTITEKRQKLSIEKQELESLCSTPQAFRRITDIALGIISKNRPVTQEYESLTKQQSLIKEQLTEIKVLQKGVVAQISNDKGKNIKYKVSRGFVGRPSLGLKVKTLASAFNGNATAAKLVARFEEDHGVYKEMSSLDIKLAQRERELKL